MTTQYNTTSDGVAIDGFDPVAYFTDGKATPGKPEHTQEWSGATWRFSSSENAAKFAEAPEKFAPQVGGHCAFGASVGKTVDASPEAWRIIDGKLYLLKSGSVKALSNLFTGKIEKTAKSWTG